jgi:flagellar motor switch protein FliM
VTSHVLTQAEIDALMEAIRAGNAADPGPPPQRRVVPFDLTRHRRAHPDELPSLDAIHQRLAAALAIGLSGWVRREIKVASGPAIPQRGSDVARILDASGSVVVLALGEGYGSAVALLEGNLAEQLLAAALGDREPAAAGGGPRRLTSVELLVLTRMLGLLSDGLAAAWADVARLRPEIARVESDPRMAAAALPDAAATTAFSLKGVIEGRLHLLLPMPLIERACRERAASRRDDAGARFSASIADALLDVAVELRVELGRRRIPMREVIALRPGDLLLLGSEETAPLPVFVQGRRKLAAAPVVASGHYAIAFAAGLDGPPAPAEGT